MDTLVVRKERRARQVTDSELEAVFASMSEEDREAARHMSVSDLEQFCSLRLDFFTASSRPVSMSNGFRTRRSVPAQTQVSSRKREVQFLRRHRAHGRSTPRKQALDTKLLEDALYMMNFGVPTPMSRRERSLYRFFTSTPTAPTGCYTTCFLTSAQAGITTSVLARCIFHAWRTIAVRTQKTATQRSCALAKHQSLALTYQTKPETA